VGFGLYRFWGFCRVFLKLNEFLRVKPCLENLENEVELWYIVRVEIFKGDTYT